MPAYIVIEAKAKNAEAYAKYIAEVPPIVVQHEGRYLVRSSDVTPGTGGWAPERIIILEFPSREHIQRCFSSPEYRSIVPLRDAGADYRSVIVEGQLPILRGR